MLKMEETIEQAQILNWLWNPSLTAWQIEKQDESIYFFKLENDLSEIEMSYNLFC